MFFFLCSKLFQKKGHYSSGGQYFKEIRYTIALYLCLLTLNPLPQTSHLNGFWLVCANIWTSRFFQFKQIFPQTLHFMSSSFSSNFSFFVGSGTDIGMAWEALIRKFPPVVLCSNQKCFFKFTANAKLRLHMGQLYLSRFLLLKKNKFSVELLKIS